MIFQRYKNEDLFDYLMDAHRRYYELAGDMRRSESIFNILISRWLELKAERYYHKAILLKGARQ